MRTKEQIFDLTDTHEIYKLIKDKDRITQRDIEEAKLEVLIDIRDILHKKFGYNEQVKTKPSEDAPKIEPVKEVGL